MNEELASRILVEVQRIGEERVLGWRRGLESDDLRESDYRQVLISLRRDFNLQTIMDTVLDLFGLTTIRYSDLSGPAKIVSLTLVNGLFSTREQERRSFLTLVDALRAAYARNPTRYVVDAADHFTLQSGFNLVSFPVK